MCDESKNDVQILYGGIHNSNEHWICIFYDSKTQSINVYDSFCKRSLTEQQLKILGELYPFLTNLSSHIVFESPKLIQYSNDSVSCGIFALYYLILIVKGCLPEDQFDFEHKHGYRSI